MGNLARFSGRICFFSPENRKESISQSLAIFQLVCCTNSPLGFLVGISCHSNLSTYFSIVCLKLCNRIVPSVKSNSIFINMILIGIQNLVRHIIDLKLETAHPKSSQPQVTCRSNFVYLFIRSFLIGLHCNSIAPSG